MADADAGVDLAAIWSIIRHRRVLVGAIALAVFGLVAAFTLSQGRVYQAEAVVELNFEGDAQGTRPSAQDSQRALQTEAEFARSSTVWLDVADQLGQEPDVEVRSSGSADVLTVIASAGDSEQAADVANTYAEAHLRLRAEQIRTEAGAETDAVTESIDALEVQAQSITDRIQSAANNGGSEPGTGTSVDTLRAERAAVESQRTGYVEQRNEIQRRAARPDAAVGSVISAATAPVSPAQPQIVRNLGIGLLLGLVLGVVAATTRDLLAGTVRDEVHLRSLDVAAPVLATVPYRSLWGRRLDSLAANPVPGGILDAARQARAAVRVLQAEQQVKSMTVTSADRGIGKSTIVTLLGTQIASGSDRVILVDADCRRPRLHRLFGLSDQPGLTDVIASRGQQLRDALRQPGSSSRLQVITAGRPYDDPGRLLSSPHLAHAIQATTEMTDLVVVDTPPLGAAGDTLEVAQVTDATLLVVQQGKTRADDVIRATADLRRWGVTVAGLILIGRAGPEDYGGERPVPSAVPPSTATTRDESSEAA